jgi:signal transduction histidine kinase
VGIAPKDQEAVFEEFRQVGTAEKKAEGTGLGLSLCRKFIELHGEQIWVQSQVGRVRRSRSRFRCVGESEPIGVTPQDAEPDLLRTAGLN